MPLNEMNNIYFYKNISVALNKDHIFIDYKHTKEEIRINSLFNKSIILYSLYWNKKLD